MFEGISQNELLMIAGAFVLGWILAKIGSFLHRRFAVSERDPRDDRIRSLEAEYRIAKSESDKNAEQTEVFKKKLQEAEDAATAGKTAMAEQFQKISSLRKDLKDSVRKTRELRAELSDRATESVRSEVKLREVETELEVSRASTDMIATGVLDYSVVPDGEDEGEGEGEDRDGHEKTEVIKALK